MAQSEMDSFYIKFKNLLHSEKDATLTIKSEAGRAFVTLSVDLGHVQSYSPHLHKSRNGPSRQRRRARRAEDRNVAVAVEASNHSVKDNKTLHVEKAEEKVTKTKNAKETYVAGEAFVSADKTVENKSKDAEQVSLEDEFCPDSEYSKFRTNDKKMCSVQFFPLDKSSKIEVFRDNVENYFKGRKDVIDKVIDCKVENCGRIVRLISSVKIRNVWLFFFNNPEVNYGDLQGVGRVLHDCRDLANCDPLV